MSGDPTRAPMAPRFLYEITGRMPWGGATVTADPPVAKPPKPALEDAVARGLKRCRALDSSFDRASIRYQDPEGSEPKNLLLMLELTDGRVALFTGGTNADDDQFLVIEPAQLSVLDEVVTRALKRSR